MQLTPILKLRKPEPNDLVKLDDFNYNAEQMEVKLGGHVEDRSIHTKALTANKNIYVSPSGSDESGDGSAANPYRTIMKAINISPKNLNGFSLYIMIANGIYLENLVIYGFYGGRLILTAHQANPDVAVSSIIFRTCHNVFSHFVRVLNFVPNAYAQVSIQHCDIVDFWGLKCEAVDKTKIGVYALRSNNVSIHQSNISGKGRAVVSDVSTVYTRYLSGDNNDIGYGIGTDGYGGIIMRGYGCSLTATTLIQEQFGGKVW